MEDFASDGNVVENNELTDEQKSKESSWMRAEEAFLDSANCNHSLSTRLMCNQINKTSAKLATEGENTSLKGKKAEIALLVSLQTNQTLHLVLKRRCHKWRGKLWSLKSLCRKQSWL